MKKHLFLLSSVLSVAVFGPQTRAGEEDLIRLTERSYVDRGMTRETVREMLGEASAKLSADVWVYLHFHAVNQMVSRVQPAADGAAKLDALVVVFQGNRVNLLRLCEGARAQALIAQQQQRYTLPAMVAAK